MKCGVRNAECGIIFGIVILSSATRSNEYNQPSAIYNPQFTIGNSALRTPHSAFSHHRPVFDLQSRSQF
jgi:hypothetical protein